MPAPTTQFLQAGRPSCHARDLVIGEVGGLNPQLFSQPPQLFLQNLSGGRLQPSQLFDTSHKI